jgi:hypothetical protein
MKIRIHRSAFILTLLLTPGCARPDRIVSIKSPTDRLFYTIETWESHGPTLADFTRVYAHFERGGKADRQLVVDGDDLERTRIIWVGPVDANLCVPAGAITDSYRNELTLFAGDSSLTIRNHLKEHCDSLPSPFATLP